MRLYKSTKTVLSVKHRAEQFLSGITSNTFDKPRNAFLNISGRIVATFDQVKLGPDEYLIAVEKDFVTDIFDHTEKFVKLSKTQIVKDTREAYFDLDGNVVLQPGDIVIPQRGGDLLLSETAHDCKVSKAEFTLYRLKNFIPVQGYDYHNEFVLNISEEEFVSFEKGCFLGQEPVSKVHHKSKPSWKLVVKYEDESSEEDKIRMTSKAQDESGRTLGFVLVSNT